MHILLSNWSHWSFIGNGTATSACAAAGSVSRSLSSYRLLPHTHSPSPGELFRQAFMDFLMSLKPTLCLLFKQRCNNSHDGRRRLARPPYRAWVSGRAAVVILPEVRGDVTADDFSLKLQNQHLITAVWAECSWHYSNEEVVGLLWSRKLIKQLKFHVQPELFWVCSQKRRVT